MCINTLGCGRVRRIDLQLGQLIANYEPLDVRGRHFIRAIIM